MSLTIVTWNVNSLRSAIRQGFVSWLETAAPDVVCLQEVRATRQQLAPLEAVFKGYQAIWHPAERPGYAGTAILTRFQPLAIEYGLNGAADPEGRALTVDFGTVSIGSFYAPNAPPETEKMEKKRVWLEQFFAHVQSHEQKPFIFGGDFNVARTALDSRGVPHPPGMNGCTKEERAWFEAAFHAGILCDPHRERTPSSILSTWWRIGERPRFSQEGVRFDYTLVRAKERAMVLDGMIHPEVFGSDHCPVHLTIDIPTESLREADLSKRQGALF